MQLIAMLDGERVDATTYSAESWAALQKSEDRKRLLMPLCNVRAVAKTRGGTTKFFAHLGRKDCRVEHGGETAQHLAMKEALKECIDSVPGWHAVVEYPHPSREWVIDVLAESDDRRNRVAFEVQLSAQTPDKYFARSQRYFDSGAFPVWLVPRPLEYHPTKIPVVVTGFTKSSDVPTKASALLDLPADQDFVVCSKKLGSFVEALLLRGYRWQHGSPGEQAERQKAEEAREAARLKAQQERVAAHEQTIAEMNSHCASPSAAFGGVVIPASDQTFVWGSLAPCWKCRKPMLVWAAMSPRRGGRWLRVPSIQVAAEVGVKRFENHPEVHSVLNKWIRVTKADIDKAVIALRRTHASGRQYSSFVCPSCDETMGQYYISRIRPENWSIISGPVIDEPQPKPQPRTVQLSGSLAPLGGGGQPIPSCDWCHRDPHPEYECLWRQLRTRANIRTGSYHYSDVTYARISRGEIAEDEGKDFMRRLLQRCAPIRPR